MDGTEIGDRGRGCTGGTIEMVMGTVMAAMLLKLLRLATMQMFATMAREDNRRR
jgi:hypothetical protein